MSPPMTMSLLRHNSNYGGYSQGQQHLKRCIFRDCGWKTDSGCVKCKLALHGLAAYLLNGWQRSSNAAVYKADVNEDGGC